MSDKPSHKDPFIQYLLRLRQKLLNMAQEVESQLKHLGYTVED